MNTSPAVIQLVLTNSNVTAFGRDFQEAVSNLIANWGYNYYPITVRGAVAMVESVAEKHQLGEVMVCPIDDVNSVFVGV